MKIFINAVVRIEHGLPIIFWNEGGIFLGCYNDREMHSEATRQYMYSLPLAPDDIAESFIDRYNRGYESTKDFIPLKLCKRLKY